MQQKTDAQINSLNASQNTLHSQSVQCTPTTSNQQKRLSDADGEFGGRSDDWCSENSSGNPPVPLQTTPPKGRPLIVTKNRKAPLAPLPSVTILSSTIGKDMNSVRVTCDGLSSTSSVGVPADDANKKPLIAKWKSGVRVQSASSTATPDSKGDKSH